MKDLEDYILDIFTRVQPGVKLRWSQIRNELLRDEELNPDLAVTKKNTSFNVKVMRVLNRLCKQNILEKHVGGHKNTSYSLSDKAPEKLLQRALEESKFEMGRAAIGLFTPDDFLNLSYKQMKAKMVERMEEVFEEFFEWKKGYEKARKDIMKKRKGNVNKNETAS